MQQVAVSWLIYRLTGSVFLLGLYGFLNQIPSFFLGPVAGVLADRWNRHTLLFITQALSMVQAFTLAVLTLTETVAVGQVMTLGFCLGLINALDHPVRQSFVVDMVESKEDLPNAIALNSTIFNGARLVGPAVAGGLIVVVGEGMCFLINALSYGAVLAALGAMRVRPVTKMGLEAAHFWQRLWEGFNYAFGSVPIRSILMLLGVISLAGLPFTQLMPVFATDVLEGGAPTLGYLMSALGLGALMGAFYMAARPDVEGLGRVLLFAAVLFSGGLMAFAWSHHLWLSLMMLVATGFGMLLYTSSSNTLLQTLVDNDKRGRVMSLYAMALLGMAPMGSLLHGELAEMIGAPGTLTLGGAIGVVGALVFGPRLLHLGDKDKPKGV